jgi:ribokinase
MANKILVVGSSNTDIVMKTNRFPLPGETILGGEFSIFQGGKGANQAVAARRAGGDVYFICSVGNDLFGNNAIKHYQEEGIDTTAIVQDAVAPTGVAVITVNSEGENSIIVASGANARLNVDQVEEAIKKISDCNWIITQLETPLEVIFYLSSYARKNKKHLILNPAPAAILPDEVYQGLFLITPNETETQFLTGIEVIDEDSAKQAAAIFKSKGVQNTMITLGSKGAYVSTDFFTGFVDAIQVKAVDTTAAGDVFNGALAIALSEGQDWKQAAEFACKAASISVTKMGAQTSAPTRKEIEINSFN